MSETNWRDEVCPSHRCTVCNAMWRYWPARDVAGIGIPEVDSWSLRSSACGKCCDMAAMGKQIVPVTTGDIEKWIVARLAVESMTQHLFGPKNGETTQ